MSHSSMHESSNIETESTLILDKKLFNYEYRNIWIVRVVGLVVVFLSLNVNENYVDENLPRKNHKWATNWIAENELNSPSYIGIEGSKPLFATVNTVENREIVNQAIKNSPIITPNAVSINKHPKIANQTNSSTVKPNIEINRNFSRTTKGLILASNNNDLTLSELSNIPEVIELATTINYERQLEYNYWIAAQNNLPNNKITSNKTKWVVRGTIGPQYSQGVVNQPSGNTYASVSNIDNMVTDAEGVSANNSNNANNAFSATLNLGLSLGSNMQLLSGVNYSQMDGAHAAYYDSEVIKSQNIITTETNTAENGVTTTKIVEEDVVYTNYFSDTLRANYRVTSVEIPLVLKYNFGKNKLNYFLSSGVSASLGSSYSAYYQSNEIGSGNITETKYGVNSVNLLFGLGMEYKATSKITIQLSPGYKYGIPASNSSVFQTPVSSLGLFTGLSYYFD